jgi:hypothetical protein
LFQTHDEDEIMTNESQFTVFVQKNGVAMAGTAEFGLTRADALSAVLIARNEDLPILGGDVYQRSSGKIVPAYANWSTEKQDSETALDCARRSWTEAEAYIQRYREPDNAELIFVLVVPKQRNA